MAEKLRTLSVTLLSALLAFSLAVLGTFELFELKAEALNEEVETTERETYIVETTEEVVEEEPIYHRFEILRIKGGDEFCEHNFATWVDTVPAAVGRAGSAMSYCTYCGAVQTKYIEPLPDSDERFTLDVENILQNPELPYGCEIVSLAIVLNYLGFDVDKVELCDNYLEKGYWGESPYEKYIGNPKDNTGTGCYADCIVNSANRFLADKGSSLKCYNVSGSSMTELEAYIDEGIPVIIWGTIFMDCDNSVCFEYWTSEQYVKWFMHSHCLVMIGHSKDTFVFADPLCGITNYSRENVEISYNQEFMQACIIK